MADFPLSPQQLDVYMDQSIHEGVPLYNIGCYLDIKGTLDFPALQKAVQLAFDRQEVLRVAFERDEETAAVTQRVQERFVYELPLIDLSDRSDAQAQASSQLRERFLTPFDTRVSPLCDFALIRITESRHYFLARVHHLIADGHGVQQLLVFIQETYNGLLKHDTELPLAPSYFDFVRKQQAYLASKHFEADRRYWQQRFPKIPPVLFPPKSRSHAQVRQGDTHRVVWTIPRGDYNAMKRVVAGMGLSEVHFLLAIISLTCFRLLDQPSVCIGVPVRNRIGAQEKATVGMFASMLPLVVDCTFDQPFSMLMAAIAARLRSDYRHQNFPISEIHRGLNLASGGRARIYDLMFSLVHFEADGALRGARYDVFPLFSGLANTALMIYMVDHSEEASVQAELVFNPDALQRADVQNIRDRLALAFTQALQRPELPLGEFSLLTTNEQERILQDFGRGPMLSPDPRLIPERVAAHAVSQPEALAVVYENENLTFGMLARRVNSLAQALRALGVGPDVLVGLHVHRGLDMIVGILGILTAGGAFVPLDPAQPAARLSMLLDEARPPVVLCEVPGAMANLVPNGTRILSFDDLDAVDGLNADASISAPAPSPSDLAYLLYTSGSTGTPKGVLIEHRDRK
ncbi:MAG: AMP-binding protein, partial [Proteobacteria bacterium]|nr:AMP-binding protein [Pseudomonadota bacterium]